MEAATEIMELFEELEACFESFRKIQALGYRLGAMSSKEVSIITQAWVVKTKKESTRGSVEGNAVVRFRDVIGSFAHEEREVIKWRNRE